jgi:hypothetical protein
MLFDLRGSGRRTTVKVVYLTLAILMGGGLVLFGIGGDVSGGLVDAITEQNSTNPGTDRYEDRARDAERRTRTNPRDAAAYAELARARYQLATLGEGFNPDTGQFSEEGRRQLEAAAAAWERHLEIAGDKADDGVASLMVQAYANQFALNEPEKAVRAQEVITEARASPQTFASLAILAYQAGQTRKGDLARREALDRADKSERNTLKSEIDSAKQTALQQQVEEAAQPTPTPEAGGGGGNDKSGGSGKNDKD